MCALGRGGELLVRAWPEGLHGVKWALGILAIGPLGPFPGGDAAGQDSGIWSLLSLHFVWPGTMYLFSLNVAFLICKVGTAVLLVWLGIVSIKWAEGKVLSSVPGTCGHSWQAAMLSLPLGLSDLTAPAEFTPLHSRSPPNLLPGHSLSTLFYLLFFHSDLSQIVKCKLLSVHS